MIFDEKKNKVILVTLNLTDPQNYNGFIKFFDGDSLKFSPNYSRFNGTYLKDLYFINNETLIIQDASGAKITFNTTNSN